MTPKQTAQVRRLHANYPLSDIKRITGLRMYEIRQAIDPSYKPNHIKAPLVRDVRERLLAEIPDDWAGTVEDYERCVEANFGERT